MTFTQAVRSVLGNYATFSGRARRSEYWWFYLFTVLVSVVAAGVDALLNTMFDNAIGIVGTVTSLALLLPSLAVTARRLHDTGRTGWWMLLPAVLLLVTVMVAFAGFLAMVVVTFNAGTAESGAATSLFLVVLVVLGLLTIAAFITLLVFLCQDSRSGPNKYGPSPKEPTPPVAPQGYYPWAGYSPEPQAPPYAQPSGWGGEPPSSPTPGSQRQQP